MSNNSNDAGQSNSSGRCTNDQHDEDLVPIDHWDPDMVQQNHVVQLLRFERPESESGESSDAANGDWVINNDFYELDLLDNTSNPNAQPPIYEVEDIEEVTDDESDNEHASDSEDHDSTYEEVVNDEGLDGGNQILNYDTSLPARHQYLGENLEELPGRQILDDNQVVELPILTRMSSTTEVLLPGQTLPLTCINIHPHVLHRLLRCIREGQKTFGLTSIADLKPGILGTTAEVRNYGLETDENGDQMLASLILQGRQKFELISVQRGDSFRYGTVKIIAESGAPSPFQLQGSLSRLSISTQKRRFDRFKSNKFPPWIHRSFDAQELMDRILTLLKHWLFSPEEIADSEDRSDVTHESQSQGNRRDTDSIKPQTSSASAEATTSRIVSLKSNMDPLEFSYWIAANIPLSNAERAHALTFNCAISRLKWELSLIEEATHLCCANCNAIICRKKDVFSMSRTGPQSSFVNEHGCIHDTLTVHRVDRILYHKNYQDIKKYSWFPGYTWTICSCWGCHSHLGWRFKADDNASLKPQKFWGLSRRNIRLTKPVTEQSSQEPPSE